MLNAGKNERLRREKQTKAFSDNFIRPKKKEKKKTEEGEKKMEKQRRGPAVCIYIYTALTTMNKTPASQALLGQFR